MENVLIIGASGGIGVALATQLRQGGAQVDTLSRSSDGFDITDAGSVDHHLANRTTRYDGIIIATGALTGAGQPPEKSIRALSADAMADQFRINCIGPAMIMRHVPRLLLRDRRAVFAVLSARVGSIGDNRLGGWYSYRTAKAGLNQMLHGFSIELARSHPRAICAALHPGTVATRFGADQRGDRDALTPDQSATALLNVINGLTPDHTGGFFDWRGQEVPW